MDTTVKLLLELQQNQPHNTAIACNILINKLIIFSLISHFPRYPGDDCMNDKECYTGHCVAGVCIV